MSGTRASVGLNRRFASNARVPIGARMGGEILKPRDPYVLQRNCVVLFREELGDPNAKEYGRNGQDQGGIDILGHRAGDPDHAVGIQCRAVQKPLKQAKILADCRAALALDFGLRELIFATTAPDDTKADQAAKAVERTLRAEGHDLTVHVYGWGQLQTLIAGHEAAYYVFMPALAATARPLDLGAGGMDVSDLAARVADEIERRGIVGAAIGIAPTPAGPEGIGVESPALHARIDLLRDLVRDGDGRVAVRRLLDLRDAPEAKDAPWARYRIETNVAAAFMDQGRESDAAECYVRAHAIRPDDPDAISNLAIARTIQGRPDEGMRLALSVLERPDRVAFAASAFLQAAARCDWEGDPESAIPADMLGSSTVQLALVDHARRRWSKGWEARALGLPDDPANKRDVDRLKALAVLSIAVDSRVHVLGGKDTVSDEQVDEAATVMSGYAVHCLRNDYAHRHDLMAHVSNAALLLRFAGRRDEAEALLRDGLRTLPEEEQLRRLLAMVLIDADRTDEALPVLAPGVEPETIMMRLQFGPGLAAAERLHRVEEMDEPADERVASIRRRLTADLALAAGDMGALGRVIDAMLAHPDDAVSAKFLDV